MIFRIAQIADIPQIMTVRMSVKENRLNNPDLVTPEDCEIYLTERGKGWVCEINNTIVGFAIADLVDHNIWALFVDPQHEKKGIGLQLHNTMLDWYFSQTQETVWLGTAPNTRAAVFYKTAGWTDLGLRSNGEIKFEMTFEAWVLS